MQSGFNPLMAAAVDYLAGSESNRRTDSSATWTSSSGDMGVFSDLDAIEDRVHFVDEYNRLAKKHRIRLLVKDDFDTCPNADRSVSQQRKSSWFRTLLRDFSGSSDGSTVRHVSGGARSLRNVSSKRSFSDIASHLIHPKKDGFKDEDLQTLVRLCGKSKFYLPLEYAPTSLVLPTCFRATGQYLVQHGTGTRGIFRVPGSAKVVNAIYDHYCPTQDQADIIDTTVSSPNLPSHVKASVHDVASAFKKFLSGLPGGILGSLALFDAFVAIHSQVYADPEVNRTKQSKLRARLIALAIGTLQSHYKRELICAVFGLLSLIGRTAEVAPREDERGRPLPTADLMGYAALGEVFGPLLVGNLLDSYSMKLANPNEGLVLLPLSPPRSRKERRTRKNSKSADDHRPPPIEVDKIQVASNIAEMIITHWREVVKHLRDLGVLRRQKDMSVVENSQAGQKQVRPSASETFGTRQSSEWKQSRPASIYTDSALPRRPSSSHIPEKPSNDVQQPNGHDPLNIKRRRPKSGRTVDRLVEEVPSWHALSPTVEETSSPHANGSDDQPTQSLDRPVGGTEHDPPQVRRDYGILLQSASPAHSPTPSSPAALRRKKIPKASSRGKDKPYTPKESQRGQRARRDTPASAWSRHDSAWTEPGHAVTKPAEADEPGVKHPAHEAQSDSRTGMASLKAKQPQATKTIGEATHTHEVPEAIRSEAGANDTGRDNNQQCTYEDVNEVKPEPSLIAQTPFVHPGEFPVTPAEPRVNSMTPYVHPGAYPESPGKGEDSEPGYPFMVDDLRPKTTGEEAHNPGNSSDTLPALTGKASTVGQSFKATLDEASNSLVRGVSSAASALAEVFSAPASGGSTSPSKIPGPQGSLRRNARPSKHRRLQRRKNLDIFRTPSNTDECPQSAIPSAEERDTEGRAAVAKKSEENMAAVPDDDLHNRHKMDTAPRTATEEGVMAPLGRLTRDISGKTKHLLGTISHPADILPKAWHPNDRSASANENERADDTVPGTDTEWPPETQESTSGVPGSHHVSSTIPCNDGNQSSKANTLRDHVEHPTGAPYNEKEEVLLNLGDFVLPTGQTTADVTQATDEPAGYFPSTTDQQHTGTPRQDPTVSHGPADPSSLQPDDDDSTNPHHFVDTRPQRSVRRLSHIFKGMRRSSTTAGTPSNRPTHLSTQSSTPNLKHPIRRPSTSADDSVTQTPTETLTLGPGRMTPYHDSPPVASHLSRKLPPRSATPSMETFPPTARPATPGSNAALYSQVITLTRQLAARTEEVAHLRRQLDAVEGEAGRTGTLSERLRVAERDAKMWKERALAAERRVVVFERFLARVRGLRERRGEEVEDKVEEEIEQAMRALDDGKGKMDGKGNEGMGQMDGGVGGQVWVMAAREVIEYDDERAWMSG